MFTLSALYFGRYYISKYFGSREAFLVLDIMESSNIVFRAYTLATKNVLAKELLLNLI